MAVGAISLFTLGILTKPAYTYLVGRLKDKSETFLTHQLAVADKINRKFLNPKPENNNAITITDADYTDDDLKFFLNDNPNITSLTLLGCTNITDEALKNLPENLTSLSLIGCDRITDKGIHHLEKLTKLETLELAGCNSITDQSLETIGKLPALKHLDLGGCFNLTNEGMEKLTNVKLESLDISDCKKIDQDGIKYLERKALKTLDLKRTAVSNTDCLGPCNNRENLSLEGSFKSINLFYAPKLTNLEISNASKIKSEGFLDPKLKVWLPKSMQELKIINSQEIVEAIQNNVLSNIKVLDLSNNEEISAIFPEKIHKENLEKLDLSGVKMQKLDLSSFPNLKEVDLRDTDLTEDNVTLNEQSPPKAIFGTKEPPPPQPLPPPDIKKEEPKKEEPKKEVIEEKKIEPKKTVKPEIFENIDINATTIKLPKKVTNGDLEYLQYFPNLENLDPSGCKNITDIGLDHLAKIKTLRSLNLTSLQLNDSGWQSVGGLKQLTSLNLTKSNISKQNIFYLSLLENLTHDLPKFEEIHKPEIVSEKKEGILDPNKYMLDTNTGTLTLSNVTDEDLKLLKA